MTKSQYLKRIIRGLVLAFCRLVGLDSRSFTQAGYQEGISGSDLDGMSKVGARGYSVQLSIQLSERQELSKLLATFATKHGLRFFDFQQGMGNRTICRIALFSRQGLHVHVDMFTSNKPGKSRASTLPIVLVGGTFANHDDWLPVIKDFDATLRRQWPTQTGEQSLTRREPINVPDLDTWRALTAQERSALQAEFSGREEALPLAQAICDDFKRNYGHINGLEFNGMSGFDTEGWMIDVAHPFVFDRRLLPRAHLGVSVRARVDGPLPPEFKDQTRSGVHARAPADYERFVDRCEDEIKHALGRPDMTRAEILDALVGSPFEQYKLQFLER